MPGEREIRAAAREKLGYDELRPGQLEASSRSSPAATRSR